MAVAVLVEMDSRMHATPAPSVRLPRKRGSLAQERRDYGIAAINTRPLRPKHRRNASEVLLDRSQLRRQHIKINGEINRHRRRYTKRLRLLQRSLRIADTSGPPAKRRAPSTLPNQHNRDARTVETSDLTRLQVLSRIGRQIAAYEMETALDHLLARERAPRKINTIDSRHSSTFRIES
jgi:hypothetical protein